MASEILFRAAALILRRGLALYAAVVAGVGAAVLPDICFLNAESSASILSRSACSPLSASSNSLWFSMLSPPVT
jgi:hypothetical protein